MKINYCLVCNSRLSDKRGKNRPKYCRMHFSKTKEYKIKTSKTWFKKGATPHNAGKVFMPEDKNPAWKGDDVGYHALHHWVSRHMGRPKLCSVCGQDDPSKRYEWANISREYKRDKGDWIRMCKKCHNDYDGVNIWQQNKRKTSRAVTVAEKI